MVSKSKVISQPLLGAHSSESEQTSLLTRREVDEEDPDRGASGCFNVANKSNDLICCSNSVEPRNIFIQKNILKILINLPLKHKFNLNEKNKSYVQKGILKKIFVKYFTKNLLLRKEGFSGYPNSVKKHIKDKSFKKIKKILKIKIRKFYNVIPKDLEWKLINLTLFLMTSKRAN